MGLSNWPEDGHMDQEPPETLAGNSMVVMNPRIETEFKKIITKSRMAKNGEKELEEEGV